MRYAGRFVVETHAHISTLYKPVETKNKQWVGEAEVFDNSAMCLYDMERYGIDMCLIKPPSQLGPSNDFHAAIVERNPDRFRAFCTEQTRIGDTADGRNHLSLGIKESGFRCKARVSCDEQRGGSRSWLDF